MEAKFTVANESIENVTQYKYLGLMISSQQNSPCIMLENRLNKAKQAFNAVMCHQRLLGLSNRRVRIQLVQAIAVSLLLYGSVIFSCLGPVRLQLVGGTSLF